MESLSGILAPFCILMSRRRNRRGRSLRMRILMVLVFISARFRQSCHCRFNSYFKGYLGSRINTNETVSQSAVFAHLSMPSGNLSGAVGGELKSNGCTAECRAQSEVCWVKRSGGRLGCRWRPAELHSMSAALF